MQPTIIWHMKVYQCEKANSSNNWKPQLEPQQQQYELLKRHEKISRCNGCQCEFDKRDSTLRILGRSEYNWLIHVDRKENIKYSPE